MLASCVASTIQPLTWSQLLIEITTNDPSLCSHDADGALDCANFNLFYTTLTTIFSGIIIVVLQVHARGTTRAHGPAAP